MTYPSDLKYTKDHEWIRVAGRRGRIGISHFAQDQLGDVVFVNLPAIGTPLKQSEMFGDIDSVKTNSALYAPVSGRVVAVNSAVNDTPEVVNKDPYGEGWMIEVELDDASEIDSLLDAAAYQATLAEH